MLSSPELCWFLVATVQGQCMSVIYRPSVYSWCSNVAQNSTVELGLTACGCFEL